MHGAIIADSVRVPWVPVKFHVHEPFKWSDWCESVELRYQIHDLNPVFWEDRDGSFSILKKGWQRLKCNRFKHRLAEVSKSVDPILSKNSVSENRRQALSKIAQQVNERYVKVGCD
jgi:succinoglycan biosynthesis protein ExoV